ncbi:MAG TPA: DUF2905 domain-containing protein [Anaerolineales bacterium]
MENIGRYLILGGIILVIVGGLLYVGGKLGFPLGRLPGDIRIERDGGGFYFPIATSLLISILLTVLLNVALRIFRK